MSPGHEGDLNGRHAWVCGASRGIGRAIAGHLAARGACLTLLARDLKALEALIASLPEPNDHRALAVDFLDPELLALTIAQGLEDRPAAHILINNSGGPAAGPILNASTTSLEAAFRQHVLAPQLLVQALVPGMAATGYGRIVNIVSTSVRQPIPGLGVSNTVRGAVASWSKTLAAELAPRGITVNNVLPGYTATERLDAIIAHRAERSGKTAEAVRAAMLAEVPMQRFASPADIAEAVGFLVSPAADYITGISLPVDGGRISSL